MYSEWASLSAQITANSCGAQCFSVLNKFPASAGREVVVSVVKQLGTNLGITQNAEPSHLVKDEEVKWCMDVICFGLSLPLQEHETIKDCVNVYCEWLTALHPQPRISVPKPICEDANLYARQIINHFHNLFVPRQGEILPFLYQTTLGADTIKRQAVLCHRVLRTLQQTAQISQQMDRQTWDTLLLFLLAINEILLAPPTVKDDVGDQLCERVLSVLFEVWLLACVRSFPSPSMWKTLQESCSMWRHRVALVDQWNRVNLALTSRLLEFSYGPAFPQLKNADEDGQLIPLGMSNDCVAQTWYRFLRMIGNPTALCSPHIISKSSHFVQWALTHEKGAETHQHPCLQMLPQIFLNAMKGISSQVDAFLGVYQPPPHQTDSVVTNLMEIRHSLNEATSSTLQQFIHSSSASNISANSQQQGSAAQQLQLQLQHQHMHHHHHLHYPHLHLHGAGSFLRDNFMSNSASSALNAIMGHHSHHQQHQQHHQQQQLSLSQSGASPTSTAALVASNLGHSMGASAVGSTSAGGSHSAGVVGSISFSTTEASLPSTGVSSTPTPPLQRRLAKSFSVAPTITQQKGLSKTSLIGLTGGGARNAIGSSSSSSYIHSSGSTSAGPVQGTGGVAAAPGSGITTATGAGTGSGSGGQAPAPAAAAAPTTPTSTSGPPSASSSINSLPLTSMGAGVELAVARPKCNSILHVFHEWLFEAAHIGGDTWRQNRKKQACEASKRPSSMIMEHRKGSISLSQPNSLNDPASLPPTLTIDKYESGRAEAIGTLCKIFCAKKTGEEILPVYLARFYMALQQCLKITESKECDETLASILLHSGDLFRLDLDGINVLLPGFIAALEIVLPDKDLKLKTQSMAFNRTELRRSAINILLSIMVLPLHYQALPIRDLSSETNEKMFTFIQLKSRLMNILMNALQVETDAQNTHMLLGGLLLCVQDAVTFEETDLGGGGSGATHLHNSGGAQHQHQHHEANLLSSGCSERSASLVSTGTASLGAQTTATMGAGSGSIRDTASAHDYPSLTISDDMSFEFGQELEGVTTYDNAHALFVRATYLVCHRLISSWKTDLNVSLAALELLSGLARLHIRETARKFTNDALECKRAVKWICDYICYQCSRPPPAHSKDLHSTIVAAFQCTAAWLMQHPYLLQDKDCLQTVLEVVELGISGTKSQSKSGDIPKFKDEKELKPASMRVRDAAENLLTIILEQVGYFPSECGPESISSLLDELALMKHCNSMVPAAAASTEQAIAKFKYFVTENSTILALLEEPLGNDQDPQPTVTLLIRGPFGRHAWTMQLRHLPRSKSGIKYHAVNPGRPIPMNDNSQRPECEQKNFPDGVDKVQPCVADYSIPTIEQIREQYGSASIRELELILENQSIHEKLAWAEADNSVDSLSHSQECVPPLVCQEFHAARLFLSHFGFLTFETRNPHNPAESLGTPPQRPLIVLDTKSTAFAADLDRLDKLSARTHDTVYVFYVKTGQTSAQQIIGNMVEEPSLTYDPHFAGMLQTLGWPVLVADHSGWTGFAHNSWSLKGTPEEQHQQHQLQQQLQLKSNVPSELNYNGSQRVLYWADVSSEIAFVVPTTWNLRYNSDISDGASIANSDQIGSSNVWARCESDTGTGPAKSKPRNLSLELETATGTGTGTGRTQKEPVPPTRRKGNVTKPTLLAQAPAKIFLVWLESYEDYLNFPLEDLLAYTRTGEELHSLQQPRAADCHVIFVHSLLSGLLRVKLQGPPGRMSFATPLVDGMVLSRRVVGNLVRQTALNISRRRRLDNDNYQPPHVRRRLKVQDIVQKYKMDLSEAELLAHLFQRAI
ncbi:ral GTPase-activating protein subunit beta isoform X4 [Drosophila pseudoobscura]|uniref:Ral GTPase-activating protein subunit beta isoform X4 n=1 Tax=Drosophila pseudoobscura pseudoobscura TaxID=46245 RepID=A0A6I8V756_DROPS|nr:ral GTPase-activating protein subunit beta isoform X4 [Drosophila pseudoobscura]